MHKKNITRVGKELSIESKVMIILHGRGANAEDILSLAGQLELQDFTLIAPAATNNSWYPYSFLAPAKQNEPWLSSALNILKETVNDLYASGIPSDKIYFLGFSQGACLSLEFAARNANKYGGIIAFTGGLIGDRIYNENYKGDFQNTPVFIGTSNPDLHVPVERVKDTEKILRAMNASVEVKIYPGMGHTVNADEIKAANKMINL